MFRHHLPYVVALFSGLASFTKIWATSFVSSSVVILITLLVPFVVASLNWLMFHHDLPRFTFPALIVATIGACLILFSAGGLLGSINGSTSDFWVGIILSTLCMLTTAAWAISVDLTKKETDVSSQNLVVISFIPPLLIALVLHLSTQENWSPWSHLSVRGIIFLLLFTFVCQFFGNFGIVTATREAGSEHTLCLRYRLPFPRFFLLLIHLSFLPPPASPFRLVQLLFTFFPFSSLFSGSPVSSSLFSSPFFHFLFPGSLFHVVFFSTLPSFLLTLLILFSFFYLFLWQVRP